MATGEAAKANPAWRRNPAQAIQLPQQYNTGAGYRYGPTSSDVEARMGHSVSTASVTGRETVDTGRGSLPCDHDQAALLGGQ
tara:strand:- start:4031 stop:4276 length:246 start_codon:yes stop_codon:yes gene_type:complete